MAITIKDKEKHVGRLTYIEGIFLDRKLINLARWTKFIRENIEKENPSNYKQDFYEVLSSYESEIKRRGDYFYKCYVEVLKIFIRASGKIKPLLEDVTEFAMIWMKSRYQINNLKQMADAIENLELKYYLYCFIYMIEIEGSYRNWIRMIFYLLYNMTDGLITLEDVEIKPLTELRDMMIARDVKDSLFEYYLDGNLRNAIAHAGFTFDKATNKMSFENKWVGRDWEAEYTLDEFIEVLHKITIIPDICADFILLLMIRDICFVHVKQG